MDMNESNLRSLLAETTSAEHKIILADQTTTVTTCTASKSPNSNKGRTNSENPDHIHEDDCSQD